MPNQKISKEKSIKRTKTFVEVAICAVLLAAGGFLIKGAVDRSKPVGRSDYEASEVEVDIPVPEDTTDPNMLLYTSVNVPTKDKFYGDLILVNNDHQYYHSGEEDLVSINELNDEQGISFFSAVDYDYTILRQAYQPMVDLITDYYNKYFDDTIIIYGSYRTTEFQKSLYDDDLAQTGNEESTRVAKAGFSEHETGLAIDLSETVDYDYTGEGDQAWINQNCYKYGFIERYQEDKTDLTHIQPEPWHFRYVGIPHAAYITRSGICLEEYIDLLRTTYPYEGDHLNFADDDGNNYEVYFVASDDGADTTSVPVPSGLKYDISGNNVDGFIVTVYKDVPETAEPTYPAQETTEAEETTGAEPDEVAG